MDLILLGIGGVGRAFIRQVVEARQLHASEFGLRLRFRLLVDSSGTVQLDRPLSDQDLSGTWLPSRQGRASAI